MNRFSRFFFLAVFCILLPVFASETQHSHVEEFGHVNFPVSCNVEVQRDFNRAVALLHSFWYSKAEQSFEAIAAADPECSMAYWGIAMSNYHPVWAPPNQKEMERGKMAVEKGLAMGGKTEREEGLLRAIAAFYFEAQTPHGERAQAFADAMGSLLEQYPEDVEIRAFYGLALLGTANVEDKTFAVQKKAGKVLDPLVEAAPSHPGVAHYVIHSFDYPQLAELALPAARAYAQIAPDSPHALHMPSHIFTRLGFWQESIESNIASATSARKNVEKTHPGAGSFEELHAMDYLVYAYLQMGNYEKAQKVLAEASSMTKVDESNLASAYALAAMPVRYAMERQAWKEAATLAVEPEWFSWEEFPYGEAIIQFARGVGAARSGDESAATDALQRLKTLHQEVAKSSEYWATQVGIQKMAVEAWVAFAQGKWDEALKLMKETAAREAASEKHPVTPGNVYPTLELLGDMLLEMNRPEDAIAAYEKSLETAPRRKNAMAGVSRAEEQMKSNKASGGLR